MLEDLTRQELEQIVISCSSQSEKARAISYLCAKGYCAGTYRDNGDDFFSAAEYWEKFPYVGIMDDYTSKYIASWRDVPSGRIPVDFSECGLSDETDEIRDDVTSLFV